MDIIMKIFWCLLAAFILGGIVGWLLKSLFCKDQINRLEADLSGRDEQIRGLRSNASAAAAEDEKEDAQFRADISARDKEIADLKGRISGLEGDLTTAKGKLDASAKMEADLAKLRADFKASEDNNASFTAKLAALQGDLTSAKAKADAGAKLEADMSKLKADLKTSQDSEASYKAKISALEGDLSAAKAKADAAAKLEADLKACQDGSASLNAKISSLESDLSGANAKLAAATAAAAAGGAAAGATVASTASGASADSGPSFDDDYDAIKARLDELEHLATDDEEDTDEELQGWEKETIALQGRITTLRGRAPNDAARAGADGLDATAVSLLEILRKARADKTAGVAKLKRPAYGHGQRDDLKEILGVGPVLEKMLNGLGVYTFREIALWDKARIEEVSSHMGSFQDRIEREDWVSQCKELHRAKYGESV